MKQFELVDLQAIMRRIFNSPDLHLTRSACSADIDGWNSLSNTLLMIEIEDATSIFISPAEVAKMPDVGRLLDAINEASMRIGVR